MKETVTSYAAELKQCTVRFGTTLDEALRDSFMSGNRNEACQCQLLSKSNQTFAQALEIAVSMETVERGSQQLWRKDMQEEQVHNVETQFSIRE